MLKHDANRDVAAVDLAATFHLSVGDCIEVLWKITRTQDGEDVVQDKWWPARICQPLPAGGDSTAARDTEGQVLWQLLYEKFEEFPEENRNVIFTGEHDLIDGDTGEEMAWRKKGDDWERGNDDDSMEEDAEHMYTASELAAMMDQQVRDASGGGSEEDVMRTLQGAVPPEQLLQGASAMRDFIDKFKEHMVKSLAASGASAGGADGLVVTKDMVDEFTRSLRSN